MLLTEWDWDKYVAVQRREAGEEGREKGREEGWLELAALLKNGKSVDEAVGILKAGDVFAG